MIRFFKTFGVSSEVFLCPRKLQGCNFLHKFDRLEPNKFEKKSDGKFGKMK